MNASNHVTVTLLPSTKRLKQLIKEHGTIWTVLRHEESVVCLSGEGFFIESADKQHTRWVRPIDVQEVPHVLPQAD